MELWEEKLGLRERFSGNAATEWGTSREDEALQRYTEITGHRVSNLSFKVLGEDGVTSWLGASPDGLVDAGGSLSGEIHQPIYIATTKFTGVGSLLTGCVRDLHVLMHNIATAEMAGVHKLISMEPVQ